MVVDRLEKVWRQVDVDMIGVEVQVKSERKEGK
jgi:hypothetical protein